MSNERTREDIDREVAELESWSRECQPNAGRVIAAAARMYHHHHPQEIRHGQERS